MMENGLNNSNSGRVTIPTDNGYEKETREIMAKWGADAIRDCDGTTLPDNARELCNKVYNTYFVIRGDNDWANANRDELQRLYLISDRVIADNIQCEITLLSGYFQEQFSVCYDNPQKYWEVIDRTCGEIVENWTLDEEHGTVKFESIKMHEYTVSFMAFCIWDPVQMYNYLTNNWDIEKQMMYDPRYPKTRKYVVEHLKQWLDNNPDTSVVRFTTFLYQFTLAFNDLKKEKYVDWFGYSMSVSPRALSDFEAEYGYSLRAEDIVDNGYYNNTFRIPSKAFLDYLDFTSKFVCEIAKELVDETHKAGKEAMMFLGDCWVGTEPYGKHFASVGLDAVVGSVGGGVTVRMLSEIPGVKYTEGRFLPYFFPDVFFEGNDPTKELNQNWLTARRAIMRKSPDRIGYGGYLKLANKFPKFIERVSDICDEFRSVFAQVSGEKPYAKIKVAILNCWGKMRSWQSHMVAHELWYQQIYSYQGLLEALSGLAIDVSFISFTDVLERGIDADVDVLINVGDAYTAFSGGENWIDTRVTETIKQWVHSGGGFVGIGEPTAYSKGGRYFQLASVLGVDKEIGFSLSQNKYNINKTENHFITADVSGAIDYGEGMKNIYALSGTEVIDIEFSNRFTRKVNVGEVKLAANKFGEGRGVYMAGLPYSFANARLLYRTLFYASGKENEILKCFSDNICTECNYYPSAQKYAILNNTEFEQTTNFYDINGTKTPITLSPMEIRWIK